MSRPEPHPKPHPKPETLAAYHAGELTEPEERRLQDHLVGCPECAALLLDLDGLSDPGFGAGSLPPADQEALWRNLQAEIREEEPLAPIVPLRRRAASPRLLQALAAALLAVTIGLSVWVASLQRKVDELSRPQENALVLDLDAGTARGEEGARPTWVIPKDVRLFTLILSPPEPRSTRYRVAMERVGGGRVWSGELVPNEAGSLSLILPRHGIPPGDYRVRLLGPGGEPVAEYALRLE
ncbi:MAG TPA: zf-HC2 domain-containing protein [Thermoanaerobaculia bacterium]